MSESVNDIDEDFQKEIHAVNKKVYAEVLRQKDVDKAKFASHWMQDEEDLQKWTDSELAADPAKQFIEAASGKRLEEVKRLFAKNGAELLNAVDTEGYTALHRAASEDAQSVCEFILSKMRGVKPNSRTNDGWTPLHCASMWNHAEIARLLLLNGADVNALTNGKLSALHSACIHSDNWEVMCELLMNPLLKLTGVTQRGDTASQLAKTQTKHGQLFDDGFDECFFLEVGEIELAEEMDVCE